MMNEMMEQCCGDDGNPDFDMMKQFCSPEGKPDAKQMKQLFEDCECCCML